MASTSLLTLYRRVAPLLGPYQTATVGTQAVGPDPARWLISGQVRADGAPPTWEGGWVQLTSSLAVRHVAHEEPSLGAIAVDQPFSAAQTVGTEYDLSMPLPIRTTNGVTGIVTFIQEACRDVWVEDRLDITPTINAYTYSLAAYAAWLDSEDRVLRDAAGQPLLYDPPAQADYRADLASWRYDELAFDGGSPTLKLRRAYLGSGGTAQLAVKRPGHTLVSGVESTTGPVANADTVAADPDEIVAVTLLKCYRYLATARHLTDAQRATYAGMAAAQEVLVRRDVRHYAPRDERPQPATQGAA